MTNSQIDFFYVGLLEGKVGGITRMTGRAALSPLLLRRISLEGQKLQSTKLSASIPRAALAALRDFHYNPCPWVTSNSLVKYHYKFKQKYRILILLILI